MEITFIRHAEKEELGEDPYLTKKGVKQAKHLAKRLKKEKFDELYCSNLNRTKQTADIISRIIGIKPQREESLKEFKAETIKKEKDGWDREEKNHYSSLINFLKKIAEDPDENKSILIIAHGITNKIILSHFLNLNLGNIIHFTQRETGVNSIYWMDKFKNWRLRIWNDDHHIPLKLKDKETYFKK